MKQPIPSSEIVDVAKKWMGGTFSTFAGSGPANYKRWQRHPGVPEFEFHSSDLDFFHTGKAALNQSIAMLEQRGAVPLDRKEERKLRRWQVRDMDSFHTQSLRLLTIDGVEINLVYKEENGRPLRRPVEIVDSFDFSNVSNAMSMRTGQWYDLAEVYWPGKDPDHVVLFPHRLEQWLLGNVTQHTGVRQGQRYASNIVKHWDMIRCKAPLVQGYGLVAQGYRDDHPDSDEHMKFAAVYDVIRILIEADDIDGLLALYEDVTPQTTIDVLYERTLP